MLQKQSSRSKLTPKVTPNISRQEYTRRRRNLMDQMEANSIAILPSALTAIRSRDTEYKFRQDSDFHYLTGFGEPDSVLVLVPGRKHGECIYFCRERDPERELWDGFRQGPEGVCQHFGADDAFPISDIDEILPGLLEGRDRVYYSMGKRPEFDRQVMDWINILRSNARTGAHPPGEFLDLEHFLHDMRLYKSAAEIRIMQQAADISANAHMHAMSICRPGMMEYELEAEYLYKFGSAGAKAEAYNSIVGSGNNACVLHYVENDCMIRDGDLVLVDAGCELNGYASDITRTFPANGHFNKQQAALYDIVLEAQIAAINVTRPGNHWNEPHDVTVEIITQGLIDLGLLNGELKELIATEAYKPFYMHRAGHWLGMDVHDVGDYKIYDEWRVLEAGMVLTVEPGIYVAPDNMSVSSKWRGIGIRIEDDIVVTKRSNEVLTDKVCKDRVSIESLMNNKSSKSRVEKKIALKKPAANKKTSKKDVKKKTSTKAAKKLTVKNKISSGKAKIKKSKQKKVIKTVSPKKKSKSKK